MIDEKTKNLIIQTVKDSGSTHPLVPIFERFVKSYSGNNKEDLDLLCMAITGLLLSHEEKRIKAQGFDEMIKVKEDMDAEIANIKDTFENLQKGIFPPEPATSIGKDSEDEAD